VTTNNTTDGDPLEQVGGDNAAQLEIGSSLGPADLVPELLALARYAAESGDIAAEMAVEVLAKIPGEEELLKRLGYLVVGDKPSRDAYEEALAADPAGFLTRPAVRV